MRLGASLLRGLSPSRRKLPRYGASDVPTFTVADIQERSLHGPAAVEVHHASPYEVQRSGAGKNVLTECCLGPAAPPIPCDTEKPTNNGLERTVCCQQKASTSTTSGGTYDFKEGISSTTIVRSCSGSLPPNVTNHVSNTNGCNCPHTCDTLTGSTDAYSRWKTSAAPTSLGRNDPRGAQILNPSIRTAQLVLEKVEREPHLNRKEATEAFATGAQQQRVKTTSNCDTPLKKPVGEQESALPSKGESGKTEQPSVLETQFGPSRAASRSRLSRTLRAATGSVLRRLTPKAANRGSAQHHVSLTESPIPFVPIVHAAAPVPAKAFAPVRLSPATSAAVAAAAAAATSKDAVRETSAASITGTSADLSYNFSKAVATLGVPLTPRPSPTSPTAGPLSSMCHSKVRFPAVVTCSPSLAVCAASCAPQWGDGSCEPSKHTGQKEIQSRQSLASLTMGHPFVRCAGNAASTNVESNTQSGMSGTAMISHRGKPPTDVRRLSSDCLYSAERRTPNAVSCKRERVGAASSSNGSESVRIAEQTEKSSSETATGSSSSNTDGTEGATGSKNDSLMAAPVLLAQDVNSIAACNPDPCIRECKKDSLTKSLSADPQSLVNTADMSQAPLADMQVGGTPRGSSAQQTPHSSSFSSFSKRPPSAAVSRQRHSSRSTRVCREKISHQRVEAVYVCPEGGELPVLKSLKVTQEITKKEERLHQKEQEETEEAETRQEAARDARPHRRTDHRRTRQGETDGREPEENKGNTRAQDSEQQREIKKGSEQKITHTGVQKEAQRLGCQYGVRPRLETRGCSTCSVPGCIPDELRSNYTLKHDQGEGENGQEKPAGAHPSFLAADVRCPKKASHCRRSRSSRKVHAGARHAHTKEGRELQGRKEESERGLPHLLIGTAAGVAEQGVAVTPEKLASQRHNLTPTDQKQQLLSEQATTQSSTHSFPSQRDPAQLRDDKRESPSFADVQSGSFSTTEGSPSNTDFSTLSSVSLQSHRGSPVSPSTLVLSTEGSLWKADNVDDKGRLSKSTTGPVPLEHAEAR